MNQKEFLKRTLSLILSGSLMLGSGAMVTGCSFSNSKESNIDNTNDINDINLEERVNNIIEYCSIEEIINILSKSEKYVSLYRPLLMSDVKVLFSESDIIIDYEEYIKGINQIINWINDEKNIENDLNEDEQRKYLNYFFGLHSAIIEILISNGYNIDITKITKFTSLWAGIGTINVKNYSFDYDNVSYNIQCGNTLQNYSWVGSWYSNQNYYYLKMNNSIKKILLCEGIIKDSTMRDYDSMFDLKLDEEKIELVEEYINNREKINNLPLKNMSYDNVSDLAEIACAKQLLLVSNSKRR